MTSRVSLVALTDQERQAVVEARRLAGEGRVQGLLEMLDAASWAVRREVIAALASMGTAAISPLVELLCTRREHEARVAAVVDVLASSAADPLAELSKLATGDDPAVLADVAQILGRRRNPRAVPLLATLVAHADDNVAVAAIEALGRITGPGGVTALVSAAESGNFFRVFPAIDVLGRTGDPRAVAPLSALLAEATYMLEAARALGRTGELAAVAPLGSLLSQPSESAVRVAALALRELHARHRERYGTASAVEAELRRVNPSSGAERRLVASLNGADTHEQIAIAFVLGTLAHDAGIAALTRMLDAKQEVADAAALALQSLGKDSEEQLEQALRTGDSARRQVLLPMFGAHANVAGVTACLHDAEAAVRALACDALARAGATVAVPDLFRLLGDPSTRVVQAAIGAIQSLGSVETSRLALLAARDSHPGVRRAAMRILAYFGDEEALPALLQALGDDDERLRSIALGGLALFESREALDALLVAARSPADNFRGAAMRALGQSVQKDPSIVATLRAGLEDADPWVRYYACQALGRIGALEATDAIVRLLNDEAGQVKVAAIEALSQLRTPLASETLMRAVEAGEPDIRRAALIGLGLHQLAEAVPTLTAALASPDAATRLIAVSALADSGFSALPAIALAAADADESVRTAAQGFLAAQPGEEATAALIGLLPHADDRQRIVGLLCTPKEGRIRAIVTALESADDDTAPLLVSALVRQRTEASAAALLDVMASAQAATRRAAATALRSLQTPKAWSALRGAAESDPEPDVRSLCAALLAQ